MPPGTETLIYHLMGLFISYLTPFNHVEWNLAFKKFPVWSYVKEILVDNKDLKQPPSLRKGQFRNRICNYRFTYKDGLSKEIK